MRLLSQILFVPAFMLLSTAALPAAVAADFPAPEGPVVLTLAGDIKNTNRGAYSGLTDLFFKYHEKEFKRAAEFDLAMLQALGRETISIRMPGESRLRKLEGTPLSTILKAVGADPRRITVTALDGFGVEIGRMELRAHDWLVAYKQDGRYLGLGQRGPLWFVFTPNAKDAQATEDEEGRWPWSAFFVLIDDNT